MKNWLIAFAGVVAVVMAGWFLFQPQKLTIVTRDGRQHIFTIELAETPQEQAQGLMWRDKMEADHGMLFTLGEQREPRFWMKNTLISLDMLFIDGKGEIKHIHPNAVPGDLTPIGSKVPVTAVFEINGGQAQARGIAVGDKVVHPYFKP